MTEFKIGDRIKLVKPYADYPLIDIHIMCEVTNLLPFLNDDDYIEVKIISSTTFPPVGSTWHVISSLFKSVTPVKINWKERLCK